MLKYVRLTDEDVHRLMGNPGLGSSAKSMSESRWNTVSFSAEWMLNRYE